MDADGRARGALLAKALLTGVLTGAVIVPFRWAVDYLLAADASLYSAALSPVGAVVVVAAMCAIGWACGFLTKLDPDVGSSGIPAVSAQLSGKLTMNWRKVLPLKFATCLMTLGAGLTMGREGPSVQIGSAVGQGVAETCKCPRTHAASLLCAGAAAGLGCAFSAPIAGVLFVAEALAERPSKQTLLCCLAASIGGGVVTACAFGTGPLLGFARIAEIPLGCYGFLVVLGVVMGLSGALYNVLLVGAKDWHDRLARRHHVPWWAFSMVPFAVTAVLCFANPVLLGSGQSMVFYAADPAAAPSWGVLAAYYFIKLGMLALCFGSGLPGGCFQPLLGLGALAGDVAAQIGVLAGVVPAELVLPLALVAMAGQFAASIRAPLTGIVLVLEVTQASQLLLPIGIVALVSYATAELLRVRPFYDLLQERIAPRA